MMSCGAEGKSLRTPPRAQKLKKHFWNWLWPGHICRAAATLSCLHSGLWFFSFFSPGWKKKWTSCGWLKVRERHDVQSQWYILRDWGKVKTFFSFSFPFSVVDDGELMSVYSSSGFMRATIEKNTWQLLPRVRYVCVLTQKTPPPLQKKREFEMSARTTTTQKKWRVFSCRQTKQKKGGDKILLLLSSIQTKKTKQNKKIRMWRKVCADGTISPRYARPECSLTETLWKNSRQVWKFGKSKYIHRSVI